MQRKQSEALFEEAKQYFPGGVNSPVRAFKSVYGAPLFIKRGSGSQIFDEDGNEFIDFCCSWGPLILGHAPEPVISALQETIVKGTSFGTPSRLGNEIGKLILDNNSFIDKLRFVSSGTEAVMSAIRLARGYTGKSKILKFDGCYHGHVDSLLVNAGSGLATFGVSSSAGVPDSFAKETLVIALDDIEQLEKTMAAHAEELACVIIEPIPANNGLLIQDKSYLEILRELCDRYKILLIFDEVISGFRVHLEGAAGYYGIKPDIITYGKIIGGGMPVGAFGGSHEIMSHVSPEGPVYQAGTLSANPVAMTAGIAMLKELIAPDFYTNLNRKTADFVQNIQSHVKSKSYKLRIEHIGSIFWFNFSLDRITKSDQIKPAGMELFKEMHKLLLENGIYLGPSGYEVGFVSAAHSSETLKIASEKICRAIDKIFA